MKNVREDFTQYIPKPEDASDLRELLSASINQIQYLESQVQQTARDIINETQDQWISDERNLYDEFKASLGTQPAIKDYCTFLKRVVFKFAICCGRVELKINKEQLKRPREMSILGIMEPKISQK